MNYYVTYLDENYVKHAEKLFFLLKKFSKFKIIAICINFDYVCNYDNVIPIRYNFNNESVIAKKFLKPVLCNELLRSNENDNFCYLDADILPIAYCDDIFDHVIQIDDYPIVARHVFDGIQSFEADPNYEQNIFEHLNFDFSIRKDKYTPYMHACVFLFNIKCSNVLDNWANLCKDQFIIDNYLKYSPIYDETILNVLLWVKKINKCFDNILIDIHDGLNIQEIYNKYKNPEDQAVFYTGFVRVPEKNNIHKIKFLHGKINDNDFNTLKKILD